MAEMVEDTTSPNNQPAPLYETVTTTVRKYYRHPPSESHAGLLEPPSELIRMPFSGLVRSGYVYDYEMTRHAPFDEDDHPEQPARITSIYESLNNSQCIKRMLKINSRNVTRAEVTLVHSPEHWDRVNMLAFIPEVELRALIPLHERMSIYVNPMTTYAALLSAGSLLELTKAVCDERIRNGFAIVRPPGHHAEPEQMMGFSFFNNASIAARWAQKNYPNSVKRPLLTPQPGMYIMVCTQLLTLITINKSTGNGTQRAFYDDPSVLYISLHRYENGTFYPGSDFGGMNMTGSGAGEGFSVNIPWPHAGMGDPEYLQAFNQVVMPISQEFAPDLVIISAGYDAAINDPLGENLITPLGYAQMTHQLSSLAGGKMVVALEGGYNLDSIATSATSTTQTLLGEIPPQAPFNSVAKTTAMETLHDVCMVQSKYWKSVSPKSNVNSSLQPSSENVTSIYEVLSKYREQLLYEKYNMFSLDITDEEIKRRFENQVMATSDLYSVDTLLVNVHDFGNLLFESKNNGEIKLDKSFLVDTTERILDMAESKKWGVIDINIFHNFANQSRQTRLLRTQIDPVKDLLVWLWDNFIDLSKPNLKVVFVGFGSACAAVTKFFEMRRSTVEKRVHASIYIPGMLDVPRVLKIMKDWYESKTLVIIPSVHDHVENGKPFKSFGKVLASTESSSWVLVEKHYDDILEWISSRNGDRLSPPSSVFAEGSNKMEVT
ncbi:hypothetical protein E3Q23_03361 [Wallemia mellicola]|nr:hypothetical protein E3Q23_03361 [Wallemia mellicola]TIB94441.1 hypothetical protein E3Q19_00336 [Wallemia mellicola]TIC28968.1 hypothetical protein E3Q11_01660 [Wallemia mellicola]TIC73138.1 hypothetical protein E3Q00_03266 [Wallemia mellicola]